MIALNYCVGLRNLTRPTIDVYRLPKCRVRIAYLFDTAIQKGTQCVPYKENP